MIGFSLKRRLVLGSVLAIVIATVLAVIGVNAVAGVAFRGIALSEIENEMRQLLAAVEINASGDLAIDDGPQDPRFDLPNGGFYWQIGRGGNVELRSQSLWDGGLPWPRKSGPPNSKPVDMKGPGGTNLIAVQRAVTLSTASGDQVVEAMIALDASQLAPVRWRFVYALAPSLGVLMLALLGAITLFLRYGLRPLDDLRTSLMAVRNRSARLISGAFPDEIQPVVDELNELIVSRETQLVQARSRAGDLAHGLKTPLTVLEAAARSLEERGEKAIAATIRDEVERMHVQVRRTLAQTRAMLAAAQISGSVEASAVLNRIVNAIRRLNRDRAITFDVAAPATITVSMDESDFTNIAGNLLDNASKWAKSRVEVSLAHEAASAMVTLIIADDGPGLPEGASDRFIARGKRLDESVAGSGFGLAIVKDIVDAYGGTLSLERATAGGLRAVVRLPRYRAHDAAEPPQLQPGAAA